MNAIPEIQMKNSLSLFLCKMDFLSHLLALSVLLALILLYNQWRRSPRDQNNKVNSAPEASGAWPVIGHLHILSEKIPISRTLGALADKYGPVFTIRLGVHRALVVSSSEAVKDCFTTNDKILAKRPHSTAGEYLGFNHAGFGFTQGPYWREIRKLVLQEMLSPRRLETLKHIREYEIQSIIKDLYENPGKVVIISEWFEQLSMNIMMMMIAGKKYADESNEEARSFRRIIKEFMYETGKFIVSDAIPFAPLRWLDFQGHIKTMKRVAEEMSVFSEEWIHEHAERERERRGSEQDFIDVMLCSIDDKFTSFGHSRHTIIKATILNLMLAGTDTTSVHLTWLLSILLNNPEAMQRAQAEIDAKVGKERWVQESDINDLAYLQATVKETLRLFPPAPLSVPHEATEECRISGFHVPKGTRIFVNLWKLHRHPHTWQDPDRFWPQRFLTSHADVDITGRHHGFIPFGSGRRSCPGMTFATQVTHLTLARLLQGFQFKTASDMPVDMSEGLGGVTLPKATPLEVVVTPRLPPTLYQN